MHRARPTRIKPSRKPGLSGRKAHARASYTELVYRGEFYRRGAYHNKGRNNPIRNNAETNLHPHLTLLEDEMEGLVPDLAQDRVHHHKQSNG